MPQVRYPNIKVKLSGKVKEVSAILNAVTIALENGGASSIEVQTFRAEAIKGNYDYALHICKKWVEVE